MNYSKLYQYIFLIFCTLFFQDAWAQEARTDKALPQPRNIKIKEEHKDSKGNTIRTIEYDQGQSHYTETVIIPPASKLMPHVSINADTMNKDSVLIVVNKQRYNLEVYYRRKMIRSYKAVFGPRP